MHIRAQGGAGVKGRARSIDMESDPFVFVAAISVAQKRGGPDGACGDIRAGESGSEREKIAHERCSVGASGAEELPKRGSRPHGDDQDH